MSIVADVRERDIIALLGGAGVECAVETLPVADFLLADARGAVCMAAERKTIPDLTASARDGRLVDQRARMREAYGPRAAFIIEGAVDHGDPAVAGIITGLVFRHGFPVFRTADKADTVALLRHLLATADRDRLFPPGAAAPEAPPAGCGKKKVRDHRDAGEGMLACVSGVSVLAARAVMAVYEDVPALVRALERDGAAAVSEIVLGKRRLGAVGDKLMTALNIRRAPR